MRETTPPRKELTPRLFLGRERHLMAHIQCGRNVLRQIVHIAGLKRSDGFANPLPFAARGNKMQKARSHSYDDKLGKAGETVKVAPAYYCSYLMPKLLAVPNIYKFAYLVRKERKIYQCEEEEEIKVVQETKIAEYLAVAKRLNNAKLVLRRFYKVDSELRQLVMKDDLLNPLSSFGEYEILRLPKSIPKLENQCETLVCSWVFHKYQKL